jgi:dienelactone hydrolase
MLALILLLLTSSMAHADGQSVTYEINGAPYEGYFIAAKPDAPFIFLLHDWDGLTDYEIQRANMLAELGYTVFAADLYGAGVRPTDPHDKRQHTGELYKDRHKLRTLMQEALKFAQSKGANIDKAVAVGYCFGGAAVLELARSAVDLQGFVTFHGGLSTPEGQNYSKTKGRLLIMHGSADTNITMDDFAELANELETFKIPHEMITYGGAPHAFTVFNSPTYRKDADQKSWNRFLLFLAEEAFQ